ncbi:hypothetical protein E4K65_24760 [Bradyrhizobium niftali]|uniref:Uncharacterized protein n=1 Tax=Bradyrhizobium niftali TaxID=2560055 RepID=A0A4Y9LPM3_9BRAD|nr:hypothetical protein E4K65_24760 [Bradyrhizobium niftali]
MCRSSSSARLPPHRHCEEPLRRSNPDFLRGKILDCFASAVALRAMADKALAMTEYGDRVHPTLNNYTARRS